MSIDDYESVFTPSWREENWLLEVFEYEYKNLPTPDLLKKYREYEAILDRIRVEEPPRKRNTKGKYRSWISVTHDYLEVLSEMARELNSREDFRKVLKEMESM